MLASDLRRHRASTQCAQMYTVHTPSLERAIMEHALAEGELIVLTGAVLERLITD